MLPVSSIIIMAIIKFPKKIGFYIQKAESSKLFKFTFNAVEFLVITLILYTLFYKKNSVIIFTKYFFSPDWLSAIGTLGAVIVSLYLSFNNNKRENESDVNLHLPYFRIDNLKPMCFKISLKNWLSMYPALYKVKNNIQPQITIVNINQVKTLTDFKMVLRLVLTIEKNNEVEYLGNIYCKPIVETSSMLGKSQYDLEILGNEQEQLEQLKDCFYWDNIDDYDPKDLEDAFKENKEISDKITREKKENYIWTNYYHNEIEQAMINKVMRANWNNGYKYTFLVRNVYISCKTVLGTEVYYRYDMDNGETYYRLDKRKIYAGFKMNVAELDKEKDNLLKFIEDKRDKIDEQDNKVQKKNQKIKKKLWEECKNQINKIRGEK